MQDLTTELRRRLDYDRERGELRRKPGFDGVVAGALVGSSTTGGKLQAEFLGRRYQVSHLIWLLETGALPTRCLIHRNGIPTDNRFENLEEQQPKRHIVSCEAHGAIEISKTRRRRKGLTCPNCGRESGKAKSAEAAKARRKTPEEKRATTIAYVAKRKELYQEAMRRHYWKTRECPNARAARSCRQQVFRVVRAIRNATTKEIDSSVGYTFEEFKTHIESQFEPWMTWTNHGKWHVDHIIPVSWYVQQGIYAPAIINALSNLRPLLKEENLKKSSKLPHANERPPSLT